MKVMPFAARRLGEVRVLGEEAVARVDRVGAGLLGDADDLRDIQVGADRVARLADLVGLVGLQAVQRIAVLVGEDGDGAGAQFICRPERADGDFTAVGHEDLLEHAATFAAAAAAHRRRLGALRLVKVT